MKKSTVWLGIMVVMAISINAMKEEPPIPSAPPASINDPRDPLHGPQVTLVFNDGTLAINRDLLTKYSKTIRTMLSEEKIKEGDIPLPFAKKTFEQVLEWLTFFESHEKQISEATSLYGVPDNILASNKILTAEQLADLIKVFNFLDIEGPLLKNGIRVDLKEYLINSLHIRLFGSSFEDLIPDKKADLIKRIESLKLGSDIIKFYFIFPIYKRVENKSTTPALVAMGSPFITKSGVRASILFGIDKKNQAFLSAFKDPLLEDFSDTKFCELRIGKDKKISACSISGQTTWIGDKEGNIGWINWIEGRCQKGTVNISDSPIKIIAGDAIGVSAGCLNSVGQLFIINRISEIEGDFTVTDPILKSATCLAVDAGVQQVLVGLSTGGIIAYKRNNSGFIAHHLRKADGKGIKAACLTPDGQIAIWISVHNELEMYDLKRSRSIFKVRYFKSPHLLSISKDGEHIVVVDKNFIRILNVVEKRVEAFIAHSLSNITACTISERGEFITITTKQGNCLIWRKQEKARTLDAFLDALINNSVADTSLKKY